MARNVLKSSLDSAKFSIIFQVLFRCVTFILNAFIIRHVGQDVLGIMNVRLLLLESTIIFLSREPLLKACLSDTKAHNWAQVINQIWLSVPLCALLGTLMAYIWINLLSGTEPKYTAQYEIGCYAIALSCVIEQITQTAILVAQSYCFVKTKVVFDTLYVVIRTITFVTLVIRNPDNAINAFSIAQIVSSLAQFLMYFIFFNWYIQAFKRNNSKSNLFKDMSDFKFSTITDFLPRPSASINKNLFVLTVSFAKQSVVKQVLTEGERYVMTISPVLTFSQQSMYDIVNNLGSLAARFIFRPIEESAYFYFTQMIKREVKLAEQVRSNVQETAIVLSQLLNVVTSIGLTVVVFGHNYSYTLLYLYGGTVLTENSLPTVLLKWHCFAILLLAINGITECYVFATMDNKQLDRYNYIMVLFSVLFLIISYVLTYFLGPVGFILANCVNMLARIVHSIKFINNQFKDLSLDPLAGLRPNKKFVIALFVSGAATKYSEAYFLQKSVILHIGFGGIFFAATLALWAYENKNLLKSGFEKYRRHSIKDE